MNGGKSSLDRFRALSGNPRKSAVRPARSADLGRERRLASGFRGIAVAVFAATTVAGVGLVGDTAFGKPAEAPSPPYAGISDPGSSFYPNGGQRFLPNSRFSPSDRGFDTALFDSHEGYLYLVTIGSRINQIPPKISKFRLSPDRTTIERVSELILGRRDNKIRTGAIDPVNGYAYFSTYDFLAYSEYDSQWGEYVYTGEAHVLKVALGEGDAAPRLVDVYDLSRTRVHTRRAKFHPGLGRFYFHVTNRPQSIMGFDVGEGDSPLASINWFPAPSGSLVSIRDYTLDTVYNYIYMSIRNGPVYEVRKRSLTPESGGQSHSATFQLESPLSWFSESFVDPVRERIYFRNGHDVGVYKLRPGAEPPTYIAAFELPSTASWEHASNHNEASRWLFVPSPRPDPTLGHAYAVYDLDGAPETDDPVIFQLGPDETNPKLRAWDPVQQVFYAMIPPRNNNPAKLVAIDLSNGPEAPQRLAELTLDRGYRDLSAFIRDDTTGSMYIANHEGDTDLVKLDFDPDSGRIEETSSLPIAPSGDTVTSGLADSAGGYAYFTLEAEDTRLLKVAMTEGDSPPEFVAEATLPPNESGFELRALDASRGHAYLGGTYASRPHLVKFALGNDDAAPHRIFGGAVGEPSYRLRQVNIDEASGLAYLTMTRSNAPAVVSKHYIGIEHQPPLFLGSLQLEPEEDLVNFSFLDESGQHLYVGTGRNSGTRVVKVRTGGKTQPLSRFGSTVTTGGQTVVNFGHIDPRDNHAWFGTTSSHRIVFRLDLGAPDALPTRVGGLSLANKTSLNANAVFDFENGMAHFHTVHSSAQLFSMTISHKHHVMGNRVTMPENGEVDGLRFFSYRPHGNLRLAVYSEGSAPELLWESNVIENTASEDWLRIPIDQGSPDTLMLPAGDYWVAWQSDSNNAIAGYQRGGSGTGFRWRRSWGPFPAVIPLDEGLETFERNGENWSLNLVYNAAEGWEEAPVHEEEEEEVYLVPLFHDADTNQDNIISLNELLRIIQLYNVGEIHCSPSSEDGFAPGPGPRECPRHSADTNENWSFELSELLRCIQLFNTGGYHRCEGTLDGYCLGPPPE